MIDEVIRIFEDGYKRIVEVRSRYGRMVMEEINNHMCDNCSKHGKCNNQLRKKCELDLEMTIYKLKIKEGNEEVSVLNEIRSKIRKLGFKDELNFYDKSICYFNSPRYPRDYRYYNVYEYHKVIDTKNKKTYIVVVKTKELQKPTTEEHIFEYVSVEEHELVDEEIPFTNTLVSNIPWYRIRPEWEYNVNSFIDILARAEREGRLQEALKEVLANVKADLWVYDYRHFYNALIETCRQLNVSLEELV